MKIRATIMTRVVATQMPIITGADIFLSLLESAVGDGEGEGVVLAGEGWGRLWTDWMRVKNSREVTETLKAERADLVEEDMIDIPGINMEIEINVSKESDEWVVKV